MCLAIVMSAALRLAAGPWIMTLTCCRERLVNAAVGSRAPFLPGGGPVSACGRVRLRSLEQASEAKGPRLDQGIG
jgi:hypothetical protein